MNKFKSVAEAFNFYKNNTVDQLTQRAAEINAEIDTNPDLDIENANIELRAIKEAKDNIELRANMSVNAAELNTIKKMDMAGAADVENVTSTPEYRTAFYKHFLGQKLNAAEARALEQARREFRNDAYTTVSEAYTIPTLSLDKVISKARTEGGIMAHCRAFSIPAKLTVPVATPLSQASYNTEGAAVESGEVNMAGVSFSGNEIIKVLSVSAAVNRMSVPALESYIVEELASNIMQGIAKNLVDGNSSGAGKGLASITFTSDNSVTFTGDSNTTLAYADIIGALKKLKRGYNKNAKFAMNCKTYYGQVMSLLDGNDRPMFVADPSGKTPGTILGKEIVLDDWIADDVIFLGDFSYLAYNMVDGIAVEASTQSSFKSGRVDFRGLAVADSQVIASEAFIKLYKSA